MELKREGAYSQTFNDKFTHILKDKMIYFNRNQEASDSLKELKKGVMNFKENVIKANDLLLERGEKVELVVKKADSLKNESSVYYSSSKKVRRITQCRKIMLYVFAVLALLLLAYFISAMICGWTWSKCGGGDSNSSRLRFLLESSFSPAKEINFSNS